MINKTQEKLEDILFIGCNYCDPKGGVAQVLRTYHKELGGLNFLPTTCNGSTLSKILIIVRTLFILLFRIKYKNIKIVHIHGSSYNSFWRKLLIIKICKWNRWKIIYHIHGGEFELFASKYKTIVSSILKDVDVLIVLSNYWKQYFEKEFNHNKIVVLPNIVETPHIIKEKNNDELVHFLFLGFLDKCKGIYDLLDVISLNQNKLRNKIKLHIGGNGEVDNVVNMIYKCNISDIVSYEGWVSNEKKSDMFNRSDVYILPSYNEGLPISILEAMTYSLPIISTPVGGIPEIVSKENGILVEPGNLNDIFNAIVTLIQDPDLRIIMGMRSRRKVEKHLPQNVIDQLYLIYNSINKVKNHI